MDIRQLEAFRAIASSGSFSLAAQKLHTTQPAISSRIRLLEEELGAELFDRGSRPTRLTTMGHRLVRHVERIIDATNDIRRTFGGVRGRINAARIGIPGALVSHWAPHLMANIYNSNPKARVELHIDRSQQLRRMLLNEELDFALVTGPIDDPVLHATSVVEHEYCWIASRNGSGRPIPKSLCELSGPIITYSKDSNAYRAMVEFLRSQERQDVELSGSNSTEAIVQLVSNGLATGLVMKAAILGGGIDTTGITILNLDASMVPSSQFWAIYRNDGDVLLGEYMTAACASMEHKAE